MAKAHSTRTSMAKSIAAQQKLMKNKMRASSGPYSSAYAALAAKDPGLVEWAKMCVPRRQLSPVARGAGPTYPYPLKRLIQKTLHEGLPEVYKAIDKWFTETDPNVNPSVTEKSAYGYNSMIINCEGNTFAIGYTEDIPSPIGRSESSTDSLPEFDFVMVYNPEYCSVVYGTTEAKLRYDDPGLFDQLATVVEMLAAWRSVVDSVRKRLMVLDGTSWDVLGSGQFSLATATLELQSLTKSLDKTFNLSQNLDTEPDEAAI